MAQAAGPLAEAVYRNGRIYTLDPKSSIISTVAVMDGKFLAVGGEADVKPFIGPQTQVIDLGGKPVIPSLNDTHNHTMQAGEAAVLVKLDDVESVAEALQRIKDAMAKKKPGEWIIGDSWHPTAQLKEQRYLTAAEIDTVAPKIPFVWETVTSPLTIRGDEDRRRRPRQVTKHRHERLAKTLKISAT
jgi:predicted amidohydrolase YtcJ